MNGKELPGILWFPDCGRERTALVGGKNASLGELMRAGIRVPPGYAVTTEVYRSFLGAAELVSGAKVRGSPLPPRRTETSATTGSHLAPKTSLEEEIRTALASVKLEDLESEESVSRHVRHLVDSAALPSICQDRIASAYCRLAEQCGIVDVPVAVRSSATAEDLPGASFAGQQETYLWVRGAEAVLKAVVRCWSSLFTSRAISYRMRMGFPHDKVHMSVGVQKMVKARAAGVAFTLNPTTGDRSKVAIEGNWGLGESVAQGEVTPDEFLVEKVTLDITRRVISSKMVEYVVATDNNRVEVRETADDRRDAPCVSDAEVVEIARLAKLIEKYYGAPQDIEWAIDADLPFPQSVVILQSRPETVWSQRKCGPVLEQRASALEHIVANLVAGKRIGDGDGRAG